MNVYSIEAGWELLHSLSFDSYDIRHACFSPLDDRIVSCHRNGEVIVWNTESGEQIHVI